MIKLEFNLCEEGSTEHAKIEFFLQDYSPKMPKSEKRGMVIICPGGGYDHLSVRESEPLAFKFMAAGYSTAILSYSVAPAKYPTALYELARIILMVRRNAEEWHIDPDNIILQGSSAGGHLAALMGCMWKEQFLKDYLSVDDSELLRPNRLILSYPVTTSGKRGHAASFQNLLGNKFDELKDKVSIEKNINADFPKTFLWHTYSDESVPVEGSLLFAITLRKYKIKFEMHIFPEGGHGLATADSMTADAAPENVRRSCSQWIDLALKWLELS
ncbi:MAG: alpha/beta hydrolase [Lachnospiraceae bacterium]|nr:alpha/beta hydrolase [Lachnospiraceae bacterium]